MKERDFEPLYQQEDEFVSIRIGKPGENTGAFIAFDANFQIGLTDQQFDSILLPLLTAISTQQSCDGYQFFQGMKGRYRLTDGRLMIVINQSTGERLIEHAQLALKHYNSYSNLENCIATQEYILYLDMGYF